LNEIQPPELVAIFSHSVEMMQWVLENNGDYYHEQIRLLRKHFLIRLPEPWRHYLLTPLYQSRCDFCRPEEKNLLMKPDSFIALKHHFRRREQKRK
jgi:hypothetical protein